MGPATDTCRFHDLREQPDLKGAAAAWFHAKWGVPEDMDFAVRLNRLAVGRGLKYGTLKHAHIVTSSRKFDAFGDWYLIRERKLVKRIFTGRDREAADRFYYDVR